MTMADQNPSSATKPSSTYASLFSQTRTANQSLDADIIVIGAGIAGSSIAYHASSNTFQARVLVLEQFGFDQPQKQQDTPATNVLLNRGSSRGGPRRIGTIGGDERTKTAWKVWQDLNNSSANKDLLDVAGEVYVVNWFPWGWLVIVIVAVYCLFKGTKSLPEGFRILWTGGQIEEKLGPRQGFRGGCWSGCVGIYHKEAAALHTDKILKYLLQPTERLQVKYGSKVTKIELTEERLDGHNNSKTVKVSVVNAGNESVLRCRHLVVAAGGWTEEILKGFYQSQNQPQLLIDNIKTKIVVFTCPVYNIKSNDAPDTPPPFSLDANCPVFSCINHKVYGFPVHPQRLAKNNESLQLSLRPFYHAFDDEDSTNPDDQRVSQDQIAKITEFTQQCFADGTVEYSHCYTCRYPKLCLDDGKKFKSVLDFVPDSNQQLVVCAGLDGYGFKFGSIYGLEFIELLETSRPPEGLNWPKPEPEKEVHWTTRLLRAIAVKIGKGISTKPSDQRKKEE